METILSFINGHTIVVASALFVALSHILSAVADYLTSIGDKVPGWLGSLSSVLSSIVGFLNGIKK